jgi:hypothetical protein
MIDDMERQCLDIKKAALKMSWYMRGGATYEDILNMSEPERNAIASIIESNLETTKKSKLPFF